MLLVTALFLAALLTSNGWWWWRMQVQHYHERKLSRRLAVTQAQLEQTQLALLHLRSHVTNVTRDSRITIRLARVRLHTVQDRLQRAVCIESAIRHEPPCPN